MISMISKVIYYKMINTINIIIWEGVRDNWLDLTTRIGISKYVLPLERRDRPHRCITSSGDHMT